MLIKRIYQADPLLCAKCGGTMKIIAVIEARQGDVVRKILEHCDLWHDPPSRAPPRESRLCPAVQATYQMDCGTTYEVDPNFLEFARREKTSQPEPLGKG